MFFCYEGPISWIRKMTASRQAAPNWIIDLFQHSQFLCPCFLPKTIIFKEEILLWNGLSIFFYPFIFSLCLSVLFYLILHIWGPVCFLSELLASMYCLLCCSLNAWKSKLFSSAMLIKIWNTILSCHVNLWSCQYCYS